MFWGHLTSLRCSPQGWIPADHSMSGAAGQVFLPLGVNGPLQPEDLGPGRFMKLLPITGVGHPGTQGGSALAAGVAPVAAGADGGNRDDEPRPAGFGREGRASSPARYLTALATYAIKIA